MMQIINGHHAEYVSPSYMSDQYVCSCGWESPKYFDGADFAFDAWMKHAEGSPASGPIINEGIGL